MTYSVKPHQDNRNTAGLFLPTHRDVGYRNGVALHISGELHSVTCVGLKEREFLIGNVVYLAVAYKNILGSPLHARQGAIPIGHPGVRRSHFRVTSAAQAIANLARPGLARGR